MIDDEPSELVRKDGHFKELGLSAGDYVDRDSVVEVLLVHPRLMQRPIIVHNGRVVIGRPSERVHEIL
ncbi:MAG: ArsC/Spx/MgsR family protein [Acidimicrobiales bacterium]